jgi:hypothetical protein
MPAQEGPPTLGRVCLEPNAAAEELQLVGGQITIEGQVLTADAAAAGIRVRWLDLASAEAQAAIAAQGPGAVRLPLVIVGGTYTLERPPFAAIVACLVALRSSASMLPAGAIRVDNARRSSHQRGGENTIASLWTVIGAAA